LTLTDGTSWRLGFIDFAMRGPTLTPFTPLTLTTPFTASLNAYFEPVIPDGHFYPGLGMAVTQIRRVPEPSTIMLVGLGIVATAFRYRRSR